MAYRVTFVHAPDPSAAVEQDYGAFFMPVWIPVLASYLPEGTASSHVDTRLDDLATLEAADLFVYSGISQDLPSILDARRVLAARYPDALHIIGGPATWALEQDQSLDVLSEFDVVHVGDGEETFGSIVEELRHGRQVDRVVRAPRRFPVPQAKPMHGPTLAEFAGRYYGAVVEVSRGCPFLCEFCDIRVLEDNNKSHNLDPELVVHELDRLSKLGVRQFMLACDNLVGDPTWANNLVDAIVTWRERTGYTPVFYTWVTLTLARMPELAARMRHAGFDALFIGVESFSSNSLAETAKLQNRSVVESVRSIAAFGFVIKPGLIVGFDADPDDVFALTAEGLLQAALLPVDLGFLVALPGTPLHRRMRLAGRLRPEALPGERRKVRSNIRFLMDADTLRRGYVEFMKTVHSGSHSYARLDAFLRLLAESDTLVPLPRGGYGSPRAFLAGALSTRSATANLLGVSWALLSRPRHLYWATRGVLRAATSGVPGWKGYLLVWGFAWATGLARTSGLTTDDIDVDSVSEVTAQSILPTGYEDAAGELIPTSKSHSQRRATIASLRRLIAERGLR